VTAPVLVRRAVGFLRQLRCHAGITPGQRHGVCAGAVIASLALSLGTGALGAGQDGHSGTGREEGLAARQAAYGGRRSITDSQPAPLGVGADGPVNIAIAVDESGSITPTEMDQERDAARLIALGEIAPDSTVSVLGFGGPDAEDRNNQQRSVDQVCPPTQVSTATSRQSLSSCIGSLKVRTEAQGWNTDFISAIDQAAADLEQGGNAGEPRLLFLLTDGYLDLYGDPAYAGTQAQVDAAAQLNLTQQALPTARKGDVEIWPLGFGQADYSELNLMAAGGAQLPCTSLPDARPHAIRVTSAAQAEVELPVVYGYARCVNAGVPRYAQLSAGGSANLTVNVPVIATAGAIEVNRQNPRIQVSFIDPRHETAPVSGTFDHGSVVQLAGTDGPVEVLRVTDPQPGTWTIHLQAPPGIGNTQIQARVLWQGVLRSDIVVNPPQPRPGQTVTVSVRIQVRNQTLVNLNALAGVSVSARVSGAGFAAPTPTPLSANINGDGVFSGSLTVPPTAKGALSFAGIVTGQGVVGDENVFATSVPSSQLQLTGQISLSQTSVSPGGTVTGVLLLDNPTGQVAQLQIVPTGADRGVTVVPPSVRVPAAAGKLPADDFTVRFASGVPLGVAGGELQVIDPADNDRIVTQTFLTVVVAVPPPPWKRFWWAEVLIALILILIVVALARRRLSQIRVRSMADIELVLYDGDREVHSLWAPAGCGSRFDFIIDESQPNRPRLELDNDGLGYVARRGPGRLVVNGPGAEPMQIQEDGRGGLGDSLSLGYRDHRLDDRLDDSPDWAKDIGDDPGEDNGRPRRRHRHRAREQAEAEVTAGDDAG
jgi:von Willebrand factor type A domain